MDIFDDYSSKHTYKTRHVVYEILKRKIIEGSLAPDESLIEERLSRQLSVSRTPVRDAIQQLEHENLIVRGINGRLKVAPISIKEAKEIFGIRTKLEEIAIVDAIDNLNEQHIIDLKNIVQMIKINQQSRNVADVLYYGSQFHEYIYTMSGNVSVNNLIKQMNNHIQRYRMLVSEENKNSVLWTATEHEKILEQIIREDKKAAKKIIKEHLENSLENVVMLMLDNSFDKLGG